MSTKVVMIGSGTPDADPYRAGPCVAVIVDETAYLVDFGSNIIRRTAKMHRLGIKCLQAKYLQYGFLTHLHLDHTLGYPDLILSPWILGRKEPLAVYGPKGLQEMTDDLMSAFKIDIKERVEGFIKADPTGCRVDVTELEKEGVIYKDELVTVEMILVKHGFLEQAFAFKFITADKTIVISGDTCYDENLIEKAKGCDILIHEIYHTKGIEGRPPRWQEYHKSVHTSAVEVGLVAKQVQPKLLVTYHPLYMLGQIAGKCDDFDQKVKNREEEMIADVRLNYSGKLIFGADDEIYE